MDRGEKILNILTSDIFVIVVILILMIGYASSEIETNKTIFITIGFSYMGFLAVVKMITSEFNEKEKEDER